MVVEPINWIEKCASVRASSIVGHIEKMKDQTEFVRKVREAGSGVGLAIDLNTPMGEIEKAVLADLDTILLMSVPAGFGGQKFDQTVLEKISKLDQIRENDKYSYMIHVDGGITLDNIKSVERRGADEVSVGKRLFEGDLKVNINKYMEKVRQ